MSSNSAMRVRYWGVTGSYATPLLPQEVQAKVLESLMRLGKDAEFCAGFAQHAQDVDWLTAQLERVVPYCYRSTFGGNTTCLQIETPGVMLVIDAGSGLLHLGEHLTRTWNAPDYRGDRTVHVLLTHAHMDHTFATPFAEPYFDRRNCICIWAPDKVLRSLHAVLSPDSALRSTFFPPTYELLEGIKQFRTVEPGDDWQLEDVRIRTLALRHPGDCLAYRLDHGDRSFVIATDHEHATSPDQELAAFARDADVIYLDAQYRRSEYEGRTSVGDGTAADRRGWGHSPVESVIETAVAARVRTLHLGHHDPRRSDEGLAELQCEAQQLARQALARIGYPNQTLEVLIAREGMSFTV